jgi:hypothetical protein
MGCSRASIIALLVLASGCPRAQVESEERAQERPSTDLLPRPDQPLPRPIEFIQCGSLGVLHGPTTTAGFEIEAIEALVARDHQALEACWAAADRPLIWRRSAVRIEIAPSGELENIHPDVFDRSDDAMEACLARAVASWKLPPSPDPVCVRVPIGDPSFAVTPPTR